MVAFMHTGTRLTAGYRYTTLGDATARVGPRGFFRAPEPIDDMAGVGSYNKALGVEVGAVDEDLIVDSLLINASGRLDKPERFKASLQSSR